MNKVLCFLALLLGIGCGDKAPPPPPIDAAIFLDALICEDGYPAVLRPGCASHAVTGADRVAYWRYDWAHEDQAQIQSTYRLSSGLAWAATFNYPPHGWFNASNGDGGDVYVSDGNTVRINYTQNGTAGGGTVAGWWVGAHCGGTGWVSFDIHTNDMAWRQWSAKLKSSLDPATCPRLDTAYTRARVARQVPIAFIVQAADGALSAQTVPLDAIVTEHYAGSAIESSAQMERQIHVAGVGPSVYWEAWSKSPITAPPAYQCAGVPAWSDPPGPGWVLMDRRCRTLVKQANPVLTGDQWGWPPAAATQ